MEIDLRSLYITWQGASAERQPWTFTVVAQHLPASKRLTILPQVSKTISVIWKYEYRRLKEFSFPYIRTASKDKNIIKNLQWGLRGKIIAPYKIRLLIFIINNYHLNKYALPLQKFSPFKISQNSTDWYFTNIGVMRALKIRGYEL